jgi:ESCRT-II complex subunit VPS25
MASFEFPAFFEYPPYFTVQPTAATARKQAELWKSLIHRYCQHHRTFVLQLEAGAYTRSHFRST